MTDTALTLRQLIRLHITGPAVELAEIEADTRISEDLCHRDALALSASVLGRFGVDLPPPTIPGKTVGELVALIEASARGMTTA